MKVFSQAQLIRDAAIFDLDGTMADCTHRLFHLDKKVPDWDSFNNLMVKDQPIDEIVSLWHYYGTANKMRIICTARDGLYKEQTELWLKKHGIIPDLLMMRETKPGVPHDKQDPDYVVKERMLDSLLGMNIRPSIVYEDRTSVVEMWRRRGIRCLQVAEGDF